MPRTALNAVSRSAMAFALTLAVSACSETGEKVFTRQNQAASALATMGMEAETSNPEKLDRIYATETQLHEACEPLRSIAAQRMGGEDVGIDTQLFALISLDRCAAETARVEDYIWVDNPTVARIYLGTQSPQEVLTPK